MTNTLSLTCSQCGGKIEIRGTTPKVTCPYCGTIQVLPPDIVAMMQDESFVVCPVCQRNDRMEKVTAITMRGYRGHDVKLSSALTLKEPEYYDLTPPKLENIEVPPRSKMADFAFSGLLLFVLSCILWWVMIYAEDTLENFVCGVIAVMIGIFSIIPMFNLPAALQEENYRKELIRQNKNKEETARRQFVERTKNLEKWKLANEQMQKRHNLKMKIWDDLYYCFRDDVVCLPADGLSARVGDMEKFVNWYVDNRTQDN